MRYRFGVESGLGLGSYRPSCFWVRFTKDKIVTYPLFIEFGSDSILGRFFYLVLQEINMIMHKDQGVS